jgi:hypothetical protein
MEDSALVELLQRNGFVDILANILVGAGDDETRNLAIFLLAYALAASEELRDQICLKGLFDTILSLDVQELSHKARCFFVRAGAKYQLPAAQQEMLTEFLFRLCFADDHTAIRSGLKGLDRMAVHDYGAIQRILEQIDSVHRFTECLQSANSKVRDAAARLLLSCVQIPDFPIGAFVTYGTAHVIFDCLLWTDDSLIALCLTFLKYLFMRELSDEVLEIAELFRAREQSGIFASITFNLKIMLLDLYEIIMGKKSLPLLQAFYSTGWVEALCDFLTVDDVNVATRIVRLLSQIRAVVPAQAAEELDALLAQREEVQHLEAFCDDPEAGFDRETADLATALLAVTK